MSLYQKDLLTAISHCKIHNLHLRDFSVPSQIGGYSRNHEISAAVYIFLSGGIKSKIGKTNYGGDRGDYGERYWRQASHIPGWPTTIKNRSTAGRDMQDIVEDFRIEYGFSPTWYNTDLIILDMSTYPFLLINNPNQCISRLESLCINYAEELGCRPIGNLRSEKTVLTAPQYTDTINNKLFTGGLHSPKKPCAPKHKKYV